MEIARFEKRIISYIIDMIIPMATFVSMTVVLTIYTKIPWYFNFIIGMFASYILGLLINVPIMGLSKGRSIGAFLLGIKTIKKDNTSINWKIAWIKNLYISLIPVVVINAIFMLTIHTEKTAFDRITSTIVVDIHEL